jgi:hypothetical protein
MSDIFIHLPYMLLRPSVTCHLSLQLLVIIKLSICSEPRISMICLSVKRRGMSTTIMMSCTLEKTDE